MQAKELKKKLREIKERQWQMPEDVDIYELVKDMFNHLGSTDSELRDDLIYSLLAHTLIESQTLTIEQIKEMLKLLLSEDYLFYHIEEVDEDGVFKRSFSVLVIACILYHHNQLEKKPLTEEEVLQIFDKTLDYTKREKDMRGYVEVKGWAHSTAHTADLLDELACCSTIAYPHLLQLLKAIKEKICQHHMTYIDNEDERLVRAVQSILERKMISHDDFNNWLYSFEEEIEKDFMKGRHINHNIKQFLRSLYFAIKKSSLDQQYLKPVNDLLVHNF